jgi:hypothetical protein
MFKFIQTSIGIEPILFQAISPENGRVRYNNTPPFGVF